ncbi:hypothetical protein C8R48DRAFT_668741 [Suillus tomentosus]|nr:hypothetical protein C8R48DRAFT_668741 [Suillus tomentosus]
MYEYPEYDNESQQMNLIASHLEASYRPISSSSVIWTPGIRQYPLCSVDHQKSFDAATASGPALWWTIGYGSICRFAVINFEVRSRFVLRRCNAVSNRRKQPRARTSIWFSLQYSIVVHDTRHSLQFGNTNFSTHAICVLLVLKEQPVPNSAT